MIYYFVPYSLEKNIGKAYNQYMSLLPNDDDWGVLMDGDIMFLNFDWGHIIHEVVKKYPDAGIFSCYTNRLAYKKEQLYSEDSHDILVHRLIAKEFDKKYRGQVKRTRSRVAGFLMVIQKKTWKEIKGFTEIPGKILDIDGLISRQIMSLGKPIYLMKGLYVLHYYRMAEGRKYKDHLRDANKYVAGKLDKEKPHIRKTTSNARRNKNIIKNRRKTRINGRSLHNDNL